MMGEERPGRPGGTLLSKLWQYDPQRVPALPFFPAPTARGSCQWSGVCVCTARVRAHTVCRSYYRYLVLHLALFL